MNARRPHRNDFVVAVVVVVGLFILCCAFVSFSWFLLLFSFVRSFSINLFGSGVEFGFSWFLFNFGLGFSSIRNVLGDLSKRPANVRNHIMWTQSEWLSIRRVLRLTLIGHNISIFLIARSLFAGARILFNWFRSASSICMTDFGFSQVRESRMVSNCDDIIRFGCLAVI